VGVNAVVAVRSSCSGSDEGEMTAMLGAAAAVPAREVVLRVRSLGAPVDVESVAEVAADCSCECCAAGREPLRSTRESGEPGGER